MKYLLTVEVWGFEAVPWSSPNIGFDTRSGKRRRFTTSKRKSDLSNGKCSLADWEQVVHACATLAMKSAGFDKPFETSLKLDYTFVAITPEGGNDGDLWNIRLRWDDKAKSWKKLSRNGKQDPDLTNIIKSTEDGLEGALCANDAIHRAGSFVGIFGPVPGVRVIVSEIEDGDYRGIVTPGMTQTLESPPCPPPSPPVA